MGDLEKAAAGKEVRHILGTVTDLVLDFKDPEGKTWLEQQEAILKDHERNERAWELWKGYSQCVTYAGKQAYILEHGIFNKGKFFSMSKRRQKRFLDNAFGFYTDLTTEKLVPRKRRNQRGIVRINPVLKFVEKTGVPFNNMMDAWASSLLMQD